jgi:DNA-binding NtrC family response regulator
MSTESIHGTGATPSVTHPVDCTSEFEQFLDQSVNQGPGEEPCSLRAWLELAEAWKITKTLRECRGNRSAAARSLGIGRRTLYAKMEKLQIAPTWAMRRTNGD